MFKNELNPTEFIQRGLLKLHSFQNEIPKLNLLNQTLDMRIWRNSSKFFTTYKINVPQKKKNLP